MYLGWCCCFVVWWSFCWRREERRISGFVEVSAVWWEDKVSVVVVREVEEDSCIEWRL